MNQPQSRISARSASASRVRPARHAAPTAHDHAAPPSGTPASRARAKTSPAASASAGEPDAPMTEQSDATTYESGTTSSMAMSTATRRAKRASRAPFAARHAAVNVLFGNRRRVAPRATPSHRNADPSPETETAPSLPSSPSPSRSLAYAAHAARGLRRAFEATSSPNTSARASKTDGRERPSRLSVPVFFFRRSQSFTPPAFLMAATSIFPASARACSSPHSASACAPCLAPSCLHAIAATAAPPSSSHQPSALPSRNKPSAVATDARSPERRTTSANPAPSTALSAARSSGNDQRRVAYFHSLLCHTQRAGGRPAARDVASSEARKADKLGRRASCASVRRSASARVMRPSTCDADTRALELGASSERGSPASSRALDAARADGRRRARPSPSCFARADVDATGGTNARHRVAAAARAGARRGAASRHPGRDAATDAARISLDATSRVPEATHASAASDEKARA